MPRILCLPGFLQSGSMLAEKASGLRKILTKKLGYELDFISPPIEISNKEQLPFRLSGDPKEEAERWDDLVAKGCNRCWWHAPSKGDSYEGFDESVKYLASYIQKNGPYDGLVGFSQGAAMAAILTNSVDKLVPSHGEFAISVLFSPFAFTVPKDSNEEMSKINSEVTDLSEFSRRAELNSQFKSFFQPAKFPTGSKIVAVYGAEDAVVPPVRTEYLCSLYPEECGIELVKHDGGHYMPNKKSFLNPIVDLFKQALESKPVL